MSDKVRIWFENSHNNISYNQALVIIDENLSSSQIKELKEIRTNKKISIIDSINLHLKQDFKTKNVIFLIRNNTIKIHFLHMLKMSDINEVIFVKSNCETKEAFFILKKIMNGVNQNINIDCLREVHSLRKRELFGSYEFRHPINDLKDFLDVCSDFQIKISIDRPMNTDIINNDINYFYKSGVLTSRLLIITHKIFSFSFKESDTLIGRSYSNILGTSKKYSNKEFNISNKGYAKNSFPKDSIREIIAANLKHEGVSTEIIKKAVFDKTSDYS